jgi:hypothetical protein
LLLYLLACALQYRYINNMMMMLNTFTALHAIWI